jgi:hypothetical protein
MIAVDPAVSLGASHGACMVSDVTATSIRLRGYGMTVALLDSPP